MTRALAVAVLLLGTGTAAAQPSAANVLASVDAAYANVKTATLDFQQTVTNVTFGDKTKSAGRMFVHRPGKLRWEYRQKRKGTIKYTKLFITDGKRLTMIDTASRRATQGAMCANLTPAAMSFLTGHGTLASAFTPTIVGTPSTTIDLELVPKQASAHYTKVVLTVDASSYLVQKSVVTDPAGNTNEFAFSNVKTGVTIKPSTFKVSLTSLANKGYTVTRHTGGCPTTGATGTGSGSGSATGTP